MPKYVIERNVPGAGELTSEELREMAQKSNAVLDGMGPEIQWLESYVAEDKLYCVYIAPNKDMVLEHAKRGGFPADRISEVRNIIDPATGGR